MGLQANDIFTVTRGTENFKMTGTQLRDFVGAKSDYNAATIADRDAGTFTDGEGNAITPDDINAGDNIFVVDASGDATVDSGWALYRVLTIAPLVFEKIKEQEGLDLVITTASNLAITQTAAGATVNNDNGSGFDIEPVSTTAAGLMTPDQLAKVHAPAVAANTPETNPIVVDSETQAIKYDPSSLLPLP